jgi:hypothetical protein
VVEVRDPWGRPAAIGTSVSVRGVGFTESAKEPRPEVGLGTMGELSVGAGNPGPGPYKLRLTRPWYVPVELEGVAPPRTSPCNFVTRIDIRHVQLQLKPNAPTIRVVVVFPPAMGIGILGYSERMAAYVDATPGYSADVKWSSTDTTVATITADGVVTVHCARRKATTRIIARSVVNPRARGEGTIEWWPSLFSGDVILGSDSAAVKACERKLAPWRIKKARNHE